MTFNHSSLSYIVLPLPSAVSNLSNMTLIFHDFQGPTIKFHDFPGFPWPVRTLMKSKVMLRPGRENAWEQALGHLVLLLIVYKDLWRQMFRPKLKRGNTTNIIEISKQDWYLCGRDINHYSIVTLSQYFFHAVIRGVCLSWWRRSYYHCWLIIIHSIEKITLKIEIYN